MFSFKVLKKWRLDLYSVCFLLRSRTKKRRNISYGWWIFKCNAKEDSTMSDYEKKYSVNVYAISYYRRLNTIPLTFDSTCCFLCNRSAFFAKWNRKVFFSFYVWPISFHERNFPHIHLCVNVCYSPTSIFCELSTHVIITIITTPDRYSITFPDQRTHTRGTSTVSLGAKRTKKKKNDVTSRCVCCLFSKTTNNSVWMLNVWILKGGNTNIITIDERPNKNSEEVKRDTRSREADGFCWRGRKYCIGKWAAL